MMGNRFEDTPNLFGYGSGQGSTGGLICEWCGRKYNYDPGGETIGFTVFGGKQICDCCFEEIENAVLNRIDHIISWYSRMLKMKKKMMEENMKNLDSVILLQSMEKERKAT